MQYFQGPNTKQILGRSRLVVADLVVFALAADAAGAAARTPVPTVAAARTVSTGNVSLFMVPSCSRASV